MKQSKNKLFKSNIFSIYSNKKCKIIFQLIIIILSKLVRLIVIQYNPYKKNNEYIEIEKYLNSCSKSEILDSNKIKISNNPKISIITPLYNTVQFLSRLIRSIQYQKFKDIEIILIDDGSSDNSSELIKKFQKKDKRIKLIHNKKNKGTFFSRNIGILKSKGSFIIFPDSDDIIAKNSLLYLYNFALKYKYEFIRFNVYINYGKSFFGEITDKLESKPIYQPELSTFIFYGLGFLKQVDYNICNKFIKREALIRSLNILDKFYLRLYMTCHEDGLLNYILYRTAKSSYFLKKFYYYYILNNYKKRRGYYNFNNIKFSFIHIMNVFNYSKNTKYEKDMTNEIFKRLIIDLRIKDRLRIINKEYNFFINAINSLDENEFFLNNYKDYLKKFKIYFLNKSSF